MKTAKSIILAILLANISIFAQDHATTQTTAEPPAHTAVEHHTEPPPAHAHDSIKHHTEPPPAHDSVKHHTELPPTHDSIKHHTELPPTHDSVKHHTELPPTHDSVKHHTELPPAHDSVKHHTELPPTHDSVGHHTEPPPAPVPVEPPVAEQPAPTLAEQPAPTPVEPPKVENAAPKPEHAWHKGIEAGLGLGVPSGIAFRAGYRFPRSESFFKNRLGFRMDYNTLGPIWSIYKNTVNNKGQSILDNDIDIDGLVIISGSKFKADLSSSHFGILIDFHPFGYIFALGGLRITAGYYFGELALSAKISNYEMNLDQEFKSKAEIKGSGDSIDVNVFIRGDLNGKDVGSLKTKMAFNSTGPYVGLGWDIGIVGGLHLTFDAGVVSSNLHKISLNLPKLVLPNNAEVEVSWKDITDPTPEQLQQFDDFLIQLKTDGYCDADNTPSCADVKNDQRIEIPPHMIQKYKDDYSNAIDDFNSKVDKEKNKALNGRKSRGDDKNGVNTLLKDWAYFPILKLGFMWRF